VPGKNSQITFRTLSKTISVNSTAKDSYEKLSERFVSLKPNNSEVTFLFTISVHTIEEEEENPDNAEEEEHDGHLIQNNIFGKEL